MTPTLTLRSFTNDQYVLDKVFYSNCYKLRGLKENGPVVVDIGAHAGYFTFAALSLGAKKIFAIEPFIENYKVLLKNIEQTDDNKVIPFQFGVYSSPAIINLNYPSISEGLFYDFSEIDIEKEGRTYPAQCYSLDQILKSFVSEHVDILKFNIGYAEFDVLSGSMLLDTQVSNVVFEVESSDDRLKTFQSHMEARGWKFVSLPIPDEPHRFTVFMSRDDLNKFFVF
jgi:FkbM family methyltransferase